MPSTWVKPVINSVVLPAHAQTSATEAPSISAPAVGPVLSLSATSFDVSTFPLGVAPQVVISSDQSVASGGTLDIVVTPAPTDPPLFIIDFTFNNSDGDPFPGFSLLLPVGGSEPSQIFTDSAGFDFGLVFSLSNDGNTLNLSLIL